VRRDRRARECPRVMRRRCVPRADRAHARRSASTRASSTCSGRRTIGTSGRSLCSNDTRDFAATAAARRLRARRRELDNHGRTVRRIERFTRPTQTARSYQLRAVDFLATLSPSATPTATLGPSSRTIETASRRASHDRRTALLRDRFHSCRRDTSEVTSDWSTTHGLDLSVKVSKYLLHETPTRLATRAA
jgi:hypothetical protein